MDKCWHQLELFDTRPFTVSPSFLKDGPQVITSGNKREKAVRERNRHHRNIGRMFSYGFSRKVTYKQGSFEGLNIMKRDDRWLAVVKTTYKGKKYVAFENAPSLRDLSWVLTMRMSGGGFRWKPDKFKTPA